MPGSGGSGALFANLKNPGGNFIFFTAGGLVTNGAFQHVALTYAKGSGTATIYYNGVLAAQVMAPPGYPPATSYNLYLGTRPGADWFAGQMDEVSIYNTNLSSAQIQAIYLAGTAGKCAVRPVIISQPTNAAVMVGGTASFSVGASGSQPLSYQWQLNQTNISALTNATATNATLVLTNVQLSQSGNLYSVVVANSAGSTNSSNALLTVIPPPSCTPPPTSLVSWWAAEGNTIDTTGNNNGTAQGGLGFAAGEVGQAFSFDGSSSSVMAPASPSLDVGSGAGFTIEGWIKPLNVSITNEPIVEWNANTVDSNIGVHLWMSVLGRGGPGGLFANLKNPVTNFIFNTATGVVTNGAFQHVALTYSKSSGTATLYYNGALAAQATAPGVNYTPATSYDLYLGTRPGSNWFDGLVDEISIYNTNLSSGQIQAIYNSGFAGKCITAPIIATQPQSQTVAVGNAAILSVGASGPGPLKYQWRLNSSNILNATNPTLTFLSAQLTNTGTYSVIVSNSIGSTPSSNALLTVVAPACVPASSNLAGWWQGDGDASDSTGLNAGAIQGGVTFAAGKVGQAFQFNGTNGLVSIPASPSLNIGTNAGLTIEGWIKPANLSAIEPLVEWNNGGSLGPVFRTSEPTAFGGGGPGSLYANIIDTNGTGHAMTTAGNLLSTTSFNHVALTYDRTNGTGTIYLNGTAVASQNLGVFIPRTSYGVILGGEPSTSSYFGGLMDEMSVYNVALSSNQVQALCNASGLGKCAVAPSVVVQPQSLSVLPGANVTIAAGVAGSRPMAYQWKLNNSTLVGTNYSLPFTNVQPSQAGSYSLSVSNALTSASTSNAVLKVNVMTVLGNGQILSNAQYSFAGSVTIQLQNFYTNGAIFYTLDGSTPTAGSTQYSGPFVVSNSCIVRALGYRPDFLQSGQSDPVTIVILPVYSVTAVTAGGGTISLNPTNGPYTNNTVVTLTATPAAGWTFFQWLGDASGTNTNTTVTVTRNEFVQAVFGTTLGATVAPPGSGSVMFNPPGGLYPFGTTVWLSAVPQPGNYFNLWGNAATGNGNTNPLPFNVVNPGQSVSTLFNSLSAGQVALTVVPVGRGRVSLTPAGTVFSTGASVTITATPSAGQSFVNWSGDAAGTQNPLPVTLNQSKTIFANFTISDQLSFEPLSIRGLGEGFELTLTGEFAMPYRIDGSTNLSNWVPLVTLTNSFGTMQYIDFGATNFPRRFYRGVPLP